MVLVLYIDGGGVNVDPCIPTMPGRKARVRFSRTRQALLAPSAERREVFAESHE